MTEKLPEENIPVSPPNIKQKKIIKRDEKMRGETEMKMLGTDRDWIFIFIYTHYYMASLFNVLQDIMNFILFLII